MSFVCDNSMRTHFFVYLTSESLNTATAYGERRRTNSTRGVRDATTKATTRWATTKATRWATTHVDCTRRDGEPGDDAMGDGTRRLHT